MGFQKIKQLVFASLCINLACSGLYQFSAGCQPMLKGLISSTWYQVSISSSGQQFYVNEAGQQVFLPGNGAAADKVQIYAGPLGNRWYIDKTGARVPIPANNTQAPVTPYNSTTQAPAQYGAPPSYPSVNAPYVPINVNPTGYPAYNYGAARPQPVNINATGTINYPTTTSDTTTGTTTGSTSGSTTGGTVSTSGEGTVTTPGGQYSVEHSGQTSVTPTDTSTTSSQGSSSTQSQSSTSNSSAARSSNPAQSQYSGSPFSSATQGAGERSNGLFGRLGQMRNQGQGLNNAGRTGPGLFSSGGGMLNPHSHGGGRAMLGDRGSGVAGGAFPELGNMRHGSVDRISGGIGVGGSHGLRDGLSNNMGKHSFGGGKMQHPGGGRSHGHRMGRR